MKDKSLNTFINSLGNDRKPYNPYNNSLLNDNIQKNLNNDYFSSYEIGVTILKT